jgi:L,D-transpeptidase YcbB
MRGFIVIIICLLVSVTPVLAQVTRAKIEQALNSKQLMETPGFSNWQELKELYNISKDSSLWINASTKSNRATLIQLLSRSEDLGLNEKDYQYDFIRSFSQPAFPLGNINDSVEAELKFSDAAIHFFSDLIYGNISPGFSYDGLNYVPRGYDLPALISKHAALNQMTVLFDKLVDLFPPVVTIRKKIERINQLSRDTKIDEEKISSSQVSHFNKPLLKKLYLLGISDSTDRQSDALVKKDLVEAQRQLNVLADGVLRPPTISELNVPLETRIEQLRLAINYYRWLSCISQQQAVVVVNIPAAYLRVYHLQTILLEMKIIVGKPSTPTPTLTSQITEVILYPYWNVPHSIATKELLPAIKRDPGFIDANNFQLITSTGKLADPHNIDWQAVTPSNFPYTVRQSTGCDNSLGLIKLNFYNPAGVYLHDTPGKGLFYLNKRFFSHGCMRMEKPMELAHLVLKNNTIAIDTLEDKGCLRNQAPITVPADQKMPLVVWYNPVDIDTTGRVVFYGDIYNKFVGRNPLSAGSAHADHK